MKAYNSSWSLLTRLRQRTSLQVQPEQFNDILSQNQKEKLGWGGSSGIELYAAIWSIPETKRGKKIYHRFEDTLINSEETELP